MTVPLSLTQSRVSQAIAVPFPQAVERPVPWQMVGWLKLSYRTWGGYFCFHQRGNQWNKTFYRTLQNECVLVMLVPCAYFQRR